jgi:hypothetical protein
VPATAPTSRSSCRSSSPAASSRNPARILDVVQDGLISIEMAKRDYGVVLSATGGLDRGATEAERRMQTR